MPNRPGRDRRRQIPRRNCAGATVITKKIDCCTPPESVAEELYLGTPNNVLVESCCDGINGCGYMEEQARCGFWPSFAHPRWLDCRTLHNRYLKTNPR